MKQSAKKPSSYGPWLVAIGAVLALAVVVVTMSPGGSRRPTDGHAPPVRVTGRSDASAVLIPALFPGERQRQAYTVAREIPAVLNRLYCWCGCRENPALRHRSLLECYEGEHASNCDICIGEAIVAGDLVKRGITDIRAIQDQIDLSFAPPPGS